VQNCGPRARSPEPGWRHTRAARPCLAEREVVWFVEWNAAHGAGVRPDSGNERWPTKSLHAKEDQPLTTTLFSWPLRWAWLNAAGVRGSWSRPRQLAALLLAWLGGERFAHEFPWKLRPDGQRLGDGEPLPAYPLWVAEVMLQQTQLAVVCCPFWRRWIWPPSPPSRRWLLQAEHDVLIASGRAWAITARARRLCSRVARPAAGSGAGRRSGPRRSDALGRGSWRVAGVAEIAPQHRRQHPPAPPTTVPFRSSMGQRERVAGATDASPPASAAQLAGFWQLSDSLLDPQRPPGVQTRP